jgi:hypothetical protein
MESQPPPTSTSPSHTQILLLDNLNLEIGREENSYLNSCNTRTTQHINNNARPTVSKTGVFSWADRGSSAEYLPT